MCQAGDSYLLLARWQPPFIFRFLSFTAVVIQFNPTSYMQAEGETVMLVVEVVGAAEVNIVARVNTQDGSASGMEGYVSLRV